MTYEFDDRDEWAELVASAVVAAAANVRRRISLRLAGYGETIPTDPASIFRSDWWSSEVHGAISEALASVASSAAVGFAAAAGVEFGDDDRDEVAAATVAAVAALLLHRGQVVAQRVEQLVARGVEQNWSATRFRDELGVTSGTLPGPLSDAVMTEVGQTAGRMSAFNAGSRTASATGVRGTKTWMTQNDERVRPAHAAVHGQTVAIDESFFVGGYPCDGPHDPSLPVSLVAGCRCWPVYRFTESRRSARSARQAAVLPHSHVPWAVSSSRDCTEVPVMTDTTQQADGYDGAGIPVLDGVPDEALIEELARRAAERAADESEADDTQAAEIAEAAVEVVEEHIEQAVEELIDNTAAEDETDESDESDEDLDGEPVMMLSFTAVNWSRFAAIGDTELPLADRDREWDGDTAARRVAEWATDPDTGDINPDLYARAFFWRDDDTDPTNVTAYKLGFADIVDGELVAVPRGIFAVAGVLAGARGGVDIPDRDRDAVEQRVRRYYERMADEFDDPSIRAPFADVSDTMPVESPEDDDGETGDNDMVYDGEGVFLVEGVTTGDGRMFAEGSVTWRELPVPLAYQDKILPYHEQGEFCGWIHKFERRGNEIWGWFTLEDNDAGRRLRDVLSNPRGAGRFGVSVDVGAASVVYSDPDGEMLDVVEATDAWRTGEDVVMLFVEAVVMGATAVMHPAFEEASIWLIEPNNSREAVAATGAGSHWRTMLVGDRPPLHKPGGVVAVTASAGGIDPLAPPADWFVLEPMEQPEPFKVYPPDSQGRVRCYGLVAQWGDCHIGFPDRCLAVPTSPDFSRFYATGSNDDAWREFYADPDLARFYAGGKYVLCDNGEMVQVGPVLLDTVHPNLWWDASDALTFYAHTGAAVADVRLYVNEHGIVAAGAVRPGVSSTDLRRFRASDISPDWRWIDGELKLVALLAVNVSGFQVQGLAASAGAFRPWACVDERSGTVKSLVAAGAVHREPRRRAVLELDAMRSELSDLRGRYESLASSFEQLVARVDRGLGPIEKERLARCLATLRVDQRGTVIDR